MKRDWSKFYRHICRYIWILCCDWTYFKWSGISATLLFPLFLAFCAIIPLVTSVKFDQIKFHLYLGTRLTFFLVFFFLTQSHTFARKSTFWRLGAWSTLEDCLLVGKVLGFGGVRPGRGNDQSYFPQVGAMPQHPNCNHCSSEKFQRFISFPQLPVCLMLIINLRLCSAFTSEKWLTTNALQFGIYCDQWSLTWPVTTHIFLSSLFINRWVDWFHLLTHWTL